MLVHGARIGFFQGDIRTLSDDLNTLKPTVFPVVPRLLNRMYDKVGGSASVSWSATDKGTQTTLVISLQWLLSVGGSMYDQSQICEVDDLVKPSPKVLWDPGL